MAEVIERPIHAEDLDLDQGPPPKKPFYKRPVYMIVIGAIALIAIIFGLRYYLYARSHESTDDAFIDAHIVQISPKVQGYILKVYVNDNQQVKAGDLLAEIDPKDYQAKLDQAQAAVEASQAGHKSAQKNVDLTRVTASANVQQASSGVSAAESQVKAAEAQTENARSKLQQSRAQVTAAIASSNQANADVSAAEADQKLAAADLQRYQQLYERDEVSKQRLDQAAAAAQTADARLQAARERAATVRAQVADARAAEQAANATVANALSQVGTARAQVGEAQGKLASAKSAPQQIAVSQANAETAGADIQRQQASLEQASLDVSYTKIYAPVDGRVTRKSIEVGAYVQVGQALMAIVPNDVWVTANFKETQLDNIRPGQPVDIDVDAYPDKVFKGHVDSIQAGTGARFSLLPPENATGNYVKVVQRVPVKIVLDEKPDPQHLLAPGMSVVPEVKVK